LTVSEKDAVKRGAIGDHPIRVARSLMAKGIMYLRIDSPNGRSGFVENTDLGRRIANHLQEQPK